MSYSSKIREQFRSISQYATRDEVIKELGISMRTYYQWKRMDTVKIQEKPKHLQEIEELETLRRSVYKAKKAKEDYKLGVGVELKDNKPIAIMHFGDMHLDSDGTDIQQVYKDITLLRETEGVYGGNLGDVTNNWVGFLGKLYGEQHTTIDESIALIEKTLGGCPWLYTIIGNHDKWNGGEYVVKNAVETGVTGEDLRLELRFPNGSMTSIHARHHFKGSSMYNTAQGSVKEALLGARDDIIVHGHIHSLGYSVVPQPELLKLSHCLSVGSYKVIDSFKTACGFRETNLSPCVVTTIDPRLPEGHTDRIKVFFDAETGVNYLKMLRS